MPSKGATLDFLYGLERHGIKPGLSRIRGLLKLLGDPHKAYPSVHIAGTNGKGSTSAFLSSILRQSRLKVGLYTSPHLLSFNERIQINGRRITDKELVKTARKVWRVCDRLGSKDQVTFFEFTTAMAFRYFKDNAVDIAVLETGMGGRLDATNVVTPLVSVITNIAHDHAEYLGDTLAEIAAQKAGIIKRRTPVVTAEDKPPALNVIKEAAFKKRAPLVTLGHDFKVYKKDSRIFPQSFDYKGGQWAFNGLEINLIGAHQLKNAACALRAAEAIDQAGFRITEAHVRSGLKKASWPARFEIVSQNPHLILDSAHNPDGARTLKDSLKPFAFRSIIFVIGIMSDKDIHGILKPLAPVASKIIVASPPTPRAASTERLLQEIKRYKKDGMAEASVKDALAKGLALAGKKDAVVVAGSIFTAAEAKRHLKAILRHL